MQRAMPLVLGSFVHLAGFTTANIVLDILSHLWPVEFSVDQFHGFIHAHMAGHTAVMLALHYQFAERGITGDPDFAFAEEHPIFVHDKRSYMPLKGTLFRSFLVQLFLIESLFALETISSSSHLLIFTMGRSHWNWTDIETICP